LDQVSKALAETNQFTSAGMHEENDSSIWPWSTPACGNTCRDQNVVVAWLGNSPVRVRDIANGPPRGAPQFNIVTAEGSEAVLNERLRQPGQQTPWRLLPICKRT